MVDFHSAEEDGHEGVVATLVIIGVAPGKENIDILEKDDAVPFLRLAEVTLGP